MGDLVNLRMARKAKARADAEALAASNRVKSGRTKGERQASAAVKEGLARHVDGHRLTRRLPQAD